MKTFEFFFFNLFGLQSGFNQRETFKLRTLKIHPVYTKYNVHTDIKQIPHIHFVTIKRILHFVKI